jgi:glutamate synthase (NADPH/NADH) small chain
MTSEKGIFSAGDMHRGQSLIVWALSEGRKAAHHIDKHLMGKSNLPVL